MSDLWTSALKAASDAHFLLEAGRCETACNRAYYAMFNVARALLLELPDQPARKIKTHASVIRSFSLAFIRNGPFDLKFGEVLRQSRNLRALVDYEGEAMTEDDAKDIIEAMDQFIAIAESLRSQDKPQ
jgi:uncharacterized protein (UPF0332 family)